MPQEGVTKSLSTFLLAIFLSLLLLPLENLGLTRGFCGVVETGTKPVKVAIYSTFIPIDLATPSTTFLAASRSWVFKSAIFSPAIWAS